jgi:imidazolonepropionase-like amidohydrolase
LNEEPSVSPTLFTNISVFDGTGSEPFRAEVLVEGNRITRVASNGESIQCDGAVRIDGGGATLMPGLIESHAHLSFPSSRGRIVRQMKLPPEENLLITAYNARVYLDHGYTSAYSAGSKGPRFEVALKKEIDAGYLPGPRLVASTFERPAYAEKDRQGPEALRRFIADMAADGVQSVKLLLSGDDAFGKGGSLVVQYTEEEVAAASEQAKRSGVWLACHAQAAASVKMAARNDFRIIYHCTHADEEALDLLEARKRDVFVAPAIGIIYAKAYLGQAFGFTSEKVADSGFLEAIELNKNVYAQMKKRGIRVLPGGDYGFPWNPIGDNARDLELFVKLFGWNPKEVLCAATQGGAALMGMADNLGEVREGFLADLLLVRDDPVRHIEMLREPNNLLAVMQDGKFHKAPEPMRGERERRGPSPIAYA